jgi:hypothetical protein
LTSVAAMKRPIRNKPTEGALFVRLATQMMPAALGRSAFTLSSTLPSVPARGYPARSTALIRDW